MGVDHLPGPGAGGQGSYKMGFGAGFADGLGGSGEIGVWYSPATREFGYYGSASAVAGVRADAGPVVSASTSNNPTGVSVIASVSVPRAGGEFGLSASKGPDGPIPVVDFSPSANSNKVVSGYVGGSATGAPSCGQLG